jgi:hypothetical protein
MPLPEWFSLQPRKDNWQTVARLRAQTEATDPNNPVPTPTTTDASLAASAITDRSHDF